MVESTEFRKTQVGLFVDRFERGKAIAMLPLCVRLVRFHLSFPFPHHPPLLWPAHIPPPVAIWPTLLNTKIGELFIIPFFFSSQLEPVKTVATMMPPTLSRPVGQVLYHYPAIPLSCPPAHHHRQVPSPQPVLPCIILISFFFLLCFFQLTSNCRKTTVAASPSGNPLTHHT
jgi:hypothetical protein